MRLKYRGHILELRIDVDLSLFIPAFPIFSFMVSLTLHLWLFPLSVWEVVHSWAYAVCWRAARHSRRRWKWPARATLPTWTNWWKISTEETTSASAYRVQLWHPGECDDFGSSFFKLLKALKCISALSSVEDSVNAQTSVWTEGARQQKTSKRLNVLYWSN